PGLMWDTLKRRQWLRKETNASSSKPGQRPSEYWRLAYERLDVMKVLWSVELALDDVNIYSKRDGFYEYSRAIQTISDSSLMENDDAAAGLLESLKRAQIV